MANEVYTRIQLKYDTADNWSKATFTPKRGEVIVYAPTSEKGVQFKVGDGTSSISALKFIGETDVGDLYDMWNRVVSLYGNDLNGPTETGNQYMTVREIAYDEITSQVPTMINNAIASAITTVLNTAV